MTLQNNVLQQLQRHVTVFLHVSRLFIGTYNVGTNNPDQDLHDFLCLPFDRKNEKTHLPDFYVLSFQEVKAQPQNMLLDALFNDPWTCACRDLLQTRGYIKLKSVRLQGLLLNVYCLRKHLLNVREVESEYTRTGLSGMWVRFTAAYVHNHVYFKRHFSSTTL